MTQQTPRHEMTKRPVLYTVPGMEGVTVRRDVVYRTTDAGALTLDLYSPPGPKTAPRPAVVVVAGYPDPGFAAMLGCRFKEMESSVSWARLLAASLGVDADRIGLWASSGNVPLALRALMRQPLKCAALCYGLMLDLEGSTTIAEAAKTFGFANPNAGKAVEDLPRDVPLFIARAGRDENPGLNDALDRFIARALACNLPVTLANHPEGPHAFDLFHDSATTRGIVGQVLAFLRRHLAIE